MHLRNLLGAKGSHVPKWLCEDPWGGAILSGTLQQGYWEGESLLKILGCQRVLSLHCITIATVNFFHFTLTMANSHILSTVAKGKLNTFSIAHKHEVNGMIQAYTSIRQMEHSFSLLFCEKWLQIHCQMWRHQHSTILGKACMQVAYSVHMHLGCNTHGHSCCHMPL